MIIQIIEESQSKLDNYYTKKISLLHFVINFSNFLLALQPINDEMPDTIIMNDECK